MSSSIFNTKIKSKKSFLEKEYFRSETVKELLKDFDNPKQHKKLHLVTGFDGYGKSFILNCLNKVVKRDKKIIINISFYPSTEKSAQLVEKILFNLYFFSEDQYIAKNGQILKDIITQINEDRKNLYNNYSNTISEKFSKIIQLIIDGGILNKNGLYIAIENLQWGDEISLKYLKTILFNLQRQENYRSQIFFAATLRKEEAKNIHYFLSEIDFNNLIRLYNLSSLNRQDCSLIFKKELSKLEKQITSHLVSNHNFNFDIFLDKAIKSYKGNPFIIQEFFRFNQKKLKSKKNRQLFLGYYKKMILPESSMIITANMELKKLNTKEKRLFKQAIVMGSFRQFEKLYQNYKTIPELISLKDHLVKRKYLLNYYSPKGIDFVNNIVVRKIKELFPPEEFSDLDFKLGIMLAGTTFRKKYPIKTALHLCKGLKKLDNREKIIYTIRYLEKLLTNRITDNFPKLKTFFLEQLELFYLKIDSPKCVKYALEKVSLVSVYENIEEAISSIKKILTDYEPYLTPSALFNIKIQLCILYINSHELNKARNIITSFSKNLLSDENKDLLQKFKLMQVRGLLHLYENNYKKSKDYFVNALVICKEIQNKELEDLTLSELSKIYSKQNKYEHALKIEKERLNYKRNNDNGIKKGEIYNRIGDIYYQLNNYREAIKYFFLEVETAKQTGSYKMLSSAFYKLALLMSDNYLYQRAEENFTEALRAARMYGERYLICLILLNLAAVYNTTGKWKKALKNISELEVIAPKISKFKLLIDASFIKINIYLQIKSHSFIPVELEKIKTLLVKLNKSDYKYQFYQARLLLENKKYQEAKKKLDKAFIIFGKDSKITNFELDFLNFEIFRRNPATEQDMLLEHLKKIKRRYTNNDNLFRLLIEEYYLTGRKKTLYKAKEMLNDLYQERKEYRFKQGIITINNILARSTD